MNLIKNFLWKNKIAISACVLTIAFGVGYWVISSPGPTTIGEDITVGNDLYVTGNVGIGTTTPEEALHVVRTGGADARIQAEGTGDINAAGLELVDSDNSKEWEITIRANSNDNLWFSGFDGVNWNTAMVIEQSSGNVGIGTKDPNQKLDVSGEIHATGDICTDQGGGICLGAVYDSGWFDVVKGGTYSKTHNLGTDKLIINVFFRPSPDEDVTLVYFTHSQYNEDCPQVTKITSNSFVIQAGANTVALVLDSTGNYVGYESGQYRVVAMSLGS